MVSPLNSNFKFWKLTEQGSVKNAKNYDRLKGALDYIYSNFQELDSLWGSASFEKFVKKIEETKTLPKDPSVQQHMAAIRDYLLLLKDGVALIKADNFQAVVPRASLRNRAPGLEKMLTVSMREEKTGLIELKEIPPEVASLFLQYLRTGDCAMSGETVLPLIQLSDQYGCDQLLAIAKSWFKTVDVQLISIRDWIRIKKSLEQYQGVRFDAISKIVKSKMTSYSKLSPEQIAEIRDEITTNEYPELFFLYVNFESLILDTALKVLEEQISEHNFSTTPFSDAKNWPFFREGEWEQVLRNLSDKLHNPTLFLIPNCDALLELEEQELKLINFNRDELEKRITTFWDTAIGANIIAPSLPSRHYHGFHTPKLIGEAIESFLKRHHYLKPHTPIVGRICAANLFKNARWLGHRYEEIPVEHEYWLGFKRIDLWFEGVYQQMRDIVASDENHGYSMMLNADQFNALIDYAERQHRPEIIETCIQWLEKPGARFEHFPQMIAYAKKRKITSLLQGFEKAMNFWNMTERKAARFLVLMQEKPSVLQELGYTQNMVVAEFILRNGIDKEDKQLYLNAYNAGSRGAAYIIGMQILEQKYPFTAPEFPVGRSIEFLTKGSTMEGTRDIELSNVYLGLGDAYCTLLKENPTEEIALQAQYAYTEALARMDEKTPLAIEVRNKSEALIKAVEDNAFNNEYLQYRLIVYK